MRTDLNLPEKVLRQAIWEKKAHPHAVDDPINQSFSGEERNRWYRNVAKDSDDPKDRDFEDQSMLSGLDSIADGRAFAIADFNRDGRPDIALTNANAPHLQLFENQIESATGFVALRFEGAATPRANQGKGSCRDGYGARVQLTLDNGRTLLREFRCGEGFAAQNSDTMLVGIGAADEVVKGSVIWPSGKQQEFGFIPSGHLLKLVEASAASALETTPYVSE